MAEYWKVQNSGWSDTNRPSWFTSEGGGYYSSKEQAIAYAKKVKKYLPTSRHRVVFCRHEETAYEIT